jgi:malic enzyme
MATARDLARAYSPGVADACMEIARDLPLVTRYTARRNLVAVVSNGSAVLIYAKTDAASAARDLFKAVAEGLEVGPILMGMGNRAHIVTSEVTQRGLIDIATLASADVASYG